jgi:hypothetical protein
VGEACPVGDGALALEVALELLVGLGSTALSSSARSSSPVAQPKTSSAHKAMLVFRTTLSEPSRELNALTRRVQRDMRAAYPAGFAPSNANALRHAKLACRAYNHSTVPAVIV